MKTLPSEAAQDLAKYLKQHEDDFISFHGEVWSQYLAQVIQDYWDSLDEHN